MKRLLAILIFLLPVLPAIAQDTIFRYDHTRVIGQVVSIGEDEIVYHRKNDPKGYNRTIRMKIVSSVHYFNGEVKNFDRDAYLRREAEMKDARSAQKEKRMVIDTRAYHSIMLNTFDLPFGVVSLSYQYDMKNGYIGLRVPVSSGAGVLAGTWKYGSTGTRDYYNYNKIFSSGVDVLFYPGGARETHRFFVGPTFEYGSTHSMEVVYQPTYPHYTYESVVRNYTGVGFKCGVLYYPHPNITIGTDFSFGMVNSLNYGSLDVLGRMGLMMGWRF